MYHFLSKRVLDENQQKKQLIFFNVRDLSIILIVLCVLLLLLFVQIVITIVQMFQFFCSIRSPDEDSFFQYSDSAQVGGQLKILKYLQFQSGNVFDVWNEDCSKEWYNVK
eukprot:TRINITY_DN302_c1_g1_i8.p5 TRINITY_DN302_c1_g1~~TRINITY_DN302_c1_g1_i8.p5  ORF type:complete len:110 (-),score=7.27 TRINITY_DN302_c1_g1_i8:221-550(-)